MNFAGKHIRIEDGRLFFPGAQQPWPPLYFGGSSEAAIDVAAQTIDKYLTWGEPPQQVAEKIAPVAARALQLGRKITFGIRLHVIVRETNDDAWKAADDLIRHASDETIAAAQAILARMDSVGQRRMAALHRGRRDKLEISPNLWAGVGLLRGGAGTALVGDPPTVAARTKEYMALGIDTFIMSATRISRKPIGLPSSCFRCCRCRSAGSPSRRTSIPGLLARSWPTAYRCAAKPLRPDGRRRREGPLGRGRRA